VRSGAASPVYNYIYGIRLDGQGPGSSVYHNDIRGCYFGIRVHDGDQAVVSRNTVDVKHTGIFVDLQTATGMDGNRVEDNDIKTEASHCIHIKNAATTNTLVRNNSMSTGANVYRIADTATGTVIYGNEFGHASAQPIGRAVRRNRPEQRSDRVELHGVDCDEYGRAGGFRAIRRHLSAGRRGKGASEF
jgi:nitrous oxidase accessory protein NosD